MRKFPPFLVLSIVLCFQSTSFMALKRERTLAMIKPDGIYGNFTDRIKQVILENGFFIVQELMVQLVVENATLFYSEHSAKSFFPNLVEYMTSGPVLAMVIEKTNGISEWRALIGPTDAGKARVSHPHSIRAMCGSSAQRNCVHGSDSALAAAREILFFFGDISAGLFYLKLANCAYVSISLQKCAVAVELHVGLGMDWRGHRRQTNRLLSHMTVEHDEL
ncbi:probable nucleoside diphosphate kinase 5 isoform X2 [Zingiber officinale]|uniref:probable nucleoside diphosphate kinase 5 isoform X2 n=1 Tax=Zingiber officinale TaxID=94328 RepID=UPI001C4AE416|nr:probable nucleoside diphosphate kinase 5 isoform X2 [Zingiber officinale]